MKRLVNILAKIYKKLDKFLNKKIYIGEAIGNILLVFSLLAMIAVGIRFMVLGEYLYIDNNGDTGHSNFCYKEKGKLYCRTDIEVKQYMK